MKTFWRVLLIVLCAAALGASAGAPAEEWLRRGNAAFAEGDYDEALQCYTRAELQTTDPGAVAFNKAATLYRLGQYPEAERHYLRCLENSQGPRRRQTLFNLGNCLLQQAHEKNLDAFEQAVQCYEQCLEDPGMDAVFRARVENNLELARLLWVRARAGQPPQQGGNKSEQNKEPRANKNKPDDGGEDAQKGPQNPRDGKGDPSRKDGQKGEDNAKQGAGKGNQATLPDNDQLAPMSVQETRALLDEVTERLRQERQKRQSLVAPHSSRVKDW
jgi:tetratricopeptide (TPR) repeat protein